LINGSKCFVIFSQIFNTIFANKTIFRDDSRRRKRFIPNPYGTIHQDAILQTKEAPESPATDDETAEDEMLKDLGHKMVSYHAVI
jgi:hypothetical protein